MNRRTRKLLGLDNLMFNPLRGDDYSEILPFDDRYLPVSFDEERDQLDSYLEDDADEPIQ